MWGSDTSFGNGAGGGFGPSSQMERKTNTTKFKKDFLVPVTCDLISEKPLSADSLKLGNTEFSKVVVCGIVSNVRNESNYMAFDLDDTTGPPLEVRQYNLNDDDNNKAASSRLSVAYTEVMEDTYVKAFGHVRTFEGKSVLSSFRVAALADLNELTMHVLECQYAKLYYTKDLFGKRQEAAASRSNGASLSQNMDLSFGSASVSNPFSAYGASSKGANGGASMTSGYAVKSNSGLKGFQDEVLQAVRASEGIDGEGTNIHELHRKHFPRKALPELRATLEALVNEGFVYSTKDDDHYKSTGQ